MSNNEYRIKNKKQIPSLMINAYNLELETWNLKLLNPRSVVKIGFFGFKLNKFAIWRKTVCNPDVSSNY